MASFFKRGKTWYYAISRTVNGESRPIKKGGFTTKKEAQAAAAEIEDKIRKGITPQLRARQFDEYFENWIEVFKPNIKKNTKARYENTLETLKEHFAGIPIQQITKRTYQEFLNRYGATRARESVRKLNTHVRACVKDAIDEGIIFVDFTRGVTITGAKEAKRDEEKHLNYLDSKRLIAEISSKLTALSHYAILLAIMSGVRFSELVGLTRKDFDFKNSQIRINKTWGYTKKMHTGFGPTKNPQSVRTIKIDKATMKIFEDYFKSKPDNIHGLVFYSPSSKYKVISNDAVNKTLGAILNRLKIEPITVHGLRHTHASVLLYEGVSIYYVSERLGHGDIETTMSYYAHIIKELRVRDERQTMRSLAKLAKK